MATVGPAWWREVRAFFDEVVELDPTRRAERLAAVDVEPALRRAVERLLAGDAAVDERLAPMETAFAPRRAGAVVAPGAMLVGPTRAASVPETLRAALAERYVVEREIGRGGTATVYLAHDRKHDRPVALKLLHQELGELIGVDRFLAEIQVTARLQHPNLLPLFDSGEVSAASAERLGHRAGMPLLFYVMPYVDGGSLRARLARERQLPVDEALRIAVAVAGALDFAHRHGVVHRDLKPENILLHDGQPLVADFGIALAISAAGAERLTRAGAFVGTPPYMSPEQVTADCPIDARSDVFALGCVLYEMLTSEPPHTGSTVQAIVSRVLSELPRPVCAVRPSVPGPVGAALDRALAKLPADRFATAREFAEAITAASSAVVTPRAGIAAPARRRASARLRDPVRFALAAALLGFGLATWSLTRARAAPVPVTMRFVVPGLVRPGAISAPFLTPDGRSIVYVDLVDGTPMLLRRPMDRLDATPIVGSEGAETPLLSPDGRWVAFSTADGKLLKLPIEGGLPIVLTDAFRGVRASWGVNDVIVMERGLNGGLAWLSAAGASRVQPLTQLARARHETVHRAPLVTPDGRAVVFTVQQDRAYGGRIAGEFALVPLDVGTAGPVPHVLIGARGRYPIAIVDGWLLYTGEEMATVMAIRLDLRARRVVGAPVTVLREAQGGGIGTYVSLSANGTFLYYQPDRTRNRPLLVDARGTARPLAGVLSGWGYRYPRLSPDGRRLTVQGTSPQGTDLWIYDLAAGTPVRLTVSGTAMAPVWTPDARRIVFATVQGNRGDFWSQAADGSAPAEKLFSADGELFPGAITPDGRTLVYHTRIDNLYSIWSAQLDGDRVPRPVVRERFDSYMPALSPDGRWLAYVSNASGRHEIYVRTFPAAGAPVQVSEGGGTEPTWARDGRRLLYRTRDSVIAATVVATPAFAVTAAVPLFACDCGRGLPHRNYDVAPDGARFVMVSRGENPDAIVIVNWLSELRTRLRAAR